METDELAQLGAERQSAVVNEAANTLRLLAQIPSVRDGVLGACDVELRAATDDDPQIDSVMVLRPNGTIVCGSRSVRPSLSFVDRAYFQQAMNASVDAPPATEIVVSRITDRPTVIAALPIPHTNLSEKPRGVITAVLSLQWLAKLAARIPDQIGHVALVIDPTSGEVLARSAQAIPLYGEQSADPTLVEALRRSPAGGAISISSVNFVPMIFGSAPVVVGTRHLMLAIGLSRKDVLKAVNDRLRVGATFALVTTLAAILVAWFAASVFVLRPITALVTVAERFGAGDLATRATTKVGISELRSLGLALNRMAGRLQVRNRQRAELQNELACSEENHRLLAESATDMITRFGPDFRRVYVSPACFELLGYVPEELLGQTSAGIVHPDDWTLLDATLNAPLRAGQERARATYRAIRKDGASIWLESSGRRLAEGAGFVMITRDVSERRTFEEKLEETNRQLEDLAARDPLTGLANRRRFEELLQTEHRRAKRLRLPISLATIDVDQFKAYNDTYGHPAGDACLRTLATAIDGVLRRPGDLAARMGGEEFSVLLPNTDASGAGIMAERIKDAALFLAIPHMKTLTGIVTISIGVATALPADDLNLTMLVKAADDALYAAKESGRNMVRIAPAIGRTDSTRG